MADNKAEHDPLMTADEAATYLKLGVQTVRNMASAGEIPKVKIGRALRFRRSDLNRWVSRQAVAERATA